MKYKLINTKTNEETICGKVVVDCFDYYVRTSHVENCWVITDSDKLVKVDKNNYEAWHEFNCKKVIATNNPNIDIPKVVNETERLAYNIAFKFIGTDFNQVKYLQSLIVEGYNKCLETHPNSDEDIKDFGYFCVKHYKEKVLPKKSFEELLQLWKQQKTKTFWYE